MALATIRPTRQGSRQRTLTYWHDLSGKWFIELRYANAVLALGKDQNAIEVGTKDKLVPTIQTVIDAVKAGELDAAMKAALAARKKPGKSA